MSVGGADEEDDGGEEGEGGVEDPLVLDQDHRARLDDGRLEEPGQAETHQDVEDIAADGVTDGHVPVTLLDDADPPQSVRNTDPGCYEGETHHSVGDAQGEPNDGDHPDHHVAGGEKYF